MLHKKRRLGLKCVYNLVFAETKGYATNEYQGNPKKSDIMLRADNQ
jgi:hypothetical protein